MIVAPTIFIINLFHMTSNTLIKKIMHKKDKKNPKKLNDGRAKFFVCDC
jgi:hypothetical protein